MYFDEKGNKVAPYEKYTECRKGFFYISCKTKKEQTQRYNKMAKYLVVPEEKPAYSNNPLDDIEKELNLEEALKPAKPYSKMTKKEMEAELNRVRALFA
jgi:hypothetical protein